jgi:hypothetical protein
LTRPTTPTKRNCGPALKSVYNFFRNIDPEGPCEGYPADGTFARLA